MSSERFRSWTLPYAIDQFILLEAHLAESEDLHQTQTRYGIENMKALQDKLTASETARDNYAEAMALVMREGIFANKAHVKRELEKMLGVKL